MRIGSGIPTDDAISHSRWPSWCAELIEKREGDEQNTGHMAPSTREQIHRFIEDATYKRSPNGEDEQRGLERVIQDWNIGGFYHGGALALEKPIA
jgi:hypothetical protein